MAHSRPFDSARRFYSARLVFSYLNRMRKNHRHFWKGLEKKSCLRCRCPMTAMCAYTNRMNPASKENVRVRQPVKHFRAVPAVSIFTPAETGRRVQSDWDVIYSSHSDSFCYVLELYPPVIYTVSLLPT